MNYLVGVDFDNTLVSYDEVLFDEAMQRGLIRPDSRKGKKSIRDSIRQLPNGEIEWQKLQAVIYGSRMMEAKQIEGVQTFLDCCKHSNTRVFIISHKTTYASQDETGTDLRTSSLSWMKARGFFEPDGLGLSLDDVYFESTSSHKIERIRTLKCTHFIDDLEETFLEECFPAHVEKILYTPHMCHSTLPEGIRVATSWEEVRDLVFGSSFS